MKRKYNIYYFPTNKGMENNTYSNHFITSLSKTNNVVNADADRKLVVDLFKYFYANIFILNWTENLAFGRKKWIKAALYMFMLLLCRLCRKKIIWIIHNKYPHEGHNRLSRLIMRYNAFISNLVITHSKEGVGYCKQHYYKRANVIYLPHPVYPESKSLEAHIEFDIIIWGAIKKYKHILEFLKFYNTCENLKNYKILLCGKCQDADYNEDIKTQLNENIYYLNDYVSYTDLNKYISASKNILFTYNDESVLSSGALIYSLPFKRKIIAPNKGSFKDLIESGCVFTYENFDDIFDLLKEDITIKEDEANIYIETNSWAQFVHNIEKYF